MPSTLLRVAIGPAPPARLDKALARDVPEGAHLSRSRLSRLIADGHVRRAGEVLTDIRATVGEGDVIEISVPEQTESHITAEAMSLAMIYEDDDLAVVDKPAGLVVHPAPGSASGTLVNGLLHHFGAVLSGVGGSRRPGIVHRIDKDTSGLLVVAKTDRAHHGLAAQFAAHSVDRRYLAVCHGVPERGDPRLAGIEGVRFEESGAIRIAASLARHRTDRQRQAVTASGGRHAVTRIRVVRSLEAAALLSCRLETGRTHQIRVHLAHVGHALIGDRVYGGRRRMPARAPGAAVADGFARQALHAATLGFEHPATGETLSFDSALPGDMTALLEALAG